MTRPASALPIPLPDHSPEPELVVPEPVVDDRAALVLVATAPRNGPAELLTVAAESIKNSILFGTHKLSKTSSAALNRTQKLADEQPLYFVAGVAAASLLAGVGLRIWRSNRYD